MKDILIPKSERGAVRVFAVNLPVADAKSLIAQTDPLALQPTSRPTDAAARQLLGVDDLDTTALELFPVRDLEGVGLADYVMDGLGVPTKDVAEDRQKLDALDGYVLIVLSKAFRGEAMTLQPASTLTLIGSYGETAVDWSSRPDPAISDSAKPFSGTASGPRFRRARATRVGGVIVAVVLALFALIVLWIVL